MKSTQTPELAMITVEQVKLEVERIRKMAGDDESAHAAEDDLHQNVLTAIMNGECEDPKVCAREAMRTQDIEFARWCA
jgi:hypothetical protein